MKGRIAPSLVLASLLACVGPSWVQTPVATDREYRVGLEHEQQAGERVSLGCDHPRALEVAELDRLLSLLRYSERRFIGKDPVERVFQEYEASRLAPALARTLSRAEPDSRVWFTSWNVGAGGLFGERRRTDGVLFVEPGGVLNIAFSRVNEVPGFDQEEPAPQTPEPYANPVGIERSTTPLVARKGYELKVTADGKEHPLWAVMKLEEPRRP